MLHGFLYITAHTTYIATSAFNCNYTDQFLPGADFPTIKYITRNDGPRVQRMLLRRPNQRPEVGNALFSRGYNRQNDSRGIHQPRRAELANN